MNKQRIHREWFDALMLKRCPNCKKETKGTVHTWGQYVNGKWRSITKWCENCFVQRVKVPLLQHISGCGCGIEFVMRGGSEMPEIVKELQGQVNEYNTISFPVKPLNDDGLMVWAIGQGLNLRYGREIGILEATRPRTGSFIAEFRAEANGLFVRNYEK